MENRRSLYLSDFSLHSLGVVLFRRSQPEVFDDFMAGFAQKLNIARLPISAYAALVDAAREFQLDFDAAYQLAVAGQYELELVTMDTDFRMAKQAGKRIRFL